MNVNKIKINRNKLNDDGHINVGLNNNFDFSGKYDSINKQFIQKEKENAINPLTDFDFFKYTFIGNNKIRYRILLKDYITVGNTVLSTKYSDVGFNTSDIILNKNVFTKSFLRLSFFDSDNPLTNNLLFNIDLYPKPIFTTNSANNLLIFFELNKNDEGFNLYYSKKDEYSLYMKASFNNAKNGKSYNLMSYNNAINNELPIDVLLNPNNKYIYTKYDLFKDNNKLVYNIDEIYSNNFFTQGDTYVINLFQIDTI